MADVQSDAPAAKLGYILTFFPPPQAAQRRIVKATITLYGFRGGYLRPTAGKDSDGATDRITLSPWVGKGQIVHSTVYTSKLTAVQWIELNALTYADGTEWHATGDRTCRVAPDGFRLVASRRK